jgi:hypothetical protein
MPILVCSCDTKVQNCILRKGGEFLYDWIEQSVQDECFLAHRQELKDRGWGAVYPKFKA